MNQAQLDQKIIEYHNKCERLGAGHFLTAITLAYCYADWENRKLMQPLMKELMERYPDYV